MTDADRDELMLLLCQEVRSHEQRISDVESGMQSLFDSLKELFDRQPPPQFEPAYQRHITLRRGEYSWPLSQRLARLDGIIAKLKADHSQS